MQCPDHRLTCIGTLASVFSSPSPVDPKRRNGLLIPVLQLAPVTTLRHAATPSRENPD